MGKGNDPNCTVGHAFSATDDQLEQARAATEANAARIAALGEWPDFIDPQASLTGRIPHPGQTDAPGFDAGVACCLNLIPADRQSLAARLHAAYIPAAVQQVRREAEIMHPDSETTWWLAACSVCREGQVDGSGFIEQLEEFATLAADGAARRDAAIRELDAMRGRYELRDGVPFATADGGMQGAYVAGHRFAAAYAEEADLYFIGTYEQSLGLEDFAWSASVDDQGRPRSGGVHGSQQFVKCASREEYQQAIRVVRDQLRD
jgi:hypothetical protein